MILFLPQESKAGIEQLQRQIQERFHYLTYGNYIVWPACRSGQPAPLYPPDGFYGNLDNDPFFAAYLVQDASFQFFGVNANGSVLSIDKCFASTLGLAWLWLEKYVWNMKERSITS